jgi:hypothetical protein
MSPRNSDHGRMMSGNDERAAFMGKLQQSLYHKLLCVEI